MIREIYASWIRIRGWLIGVISLIVGVGSYYWIGDWALTGKIAMPIAIALTICSILFFDAFVMARSKTILPRIIRVMPAHKPYALHSCILVTESSQVFGHDSYVTVFRKDAECEIMTAHGTVLNRQENGYLQIGITFMSEVEEEIVTKIQGNDSAVISALLVKPTITKYALEASQ